MTTLIRTLSFLVTLTCFVVARPVDDNLVMSSNEIKGIFRRYKEAKKMEYKRKLPTGCIDCFLDDENDVLPKSKKLTKAVIGERFFADSGYAPAYRNDVVVTRTGGKKSKSGNKKDGKKKKLRKEGNRKGKKQKDMKRRKDKRGGKKKYETVTDLVGLGKKRRRRPDQLTSVISIGALGNMRKFFGDIRANFRPDNQLDNDILQNDAPAASFDEPEYHFRDLETDSIPSYEALRVPESPKENRRKFEPRFTKVKSLKYDPSFLWAGLG